MTRHEQQLDDVSGLLGDLRDIFDRMDETEFGKLNKLFDQGATICDRATKLVVTLAHEIDWEAEASA